MWWLFVGMIGGIGFAQDGATDEARALYDQGVRYYTDKDYETAIRLWEKSYDLAPLPAILHNIAKAQEEANLPREALETWRAYFAVAPPEGRGAAEERITSLEVVVAALGPEERDIRPAPLPLPAPVPSERVREHRSHRGLWAGLLAAGATGGVVGGGLLATQARSAGDTLAQGGCVTLGASTLCDDSTAAALRSEQLRFVVGASLIGGGVALGAGTVWVAVRPSTSDVSVALAGRW